MRLASIHFSANDTKTDSATQVFFLRYGLKVIRVHASRLAAEMVNNETRGNRATEPEIGETVRSQILAIDPNISVAP